MPGSFYIDAYFLLAYQEDSEEGHYARDVIGSCENQKRLHGRVLKVPIITAGEAICECAYQDYDGTDLAALIEEKEIDTPAPSIAICQLAIEIINRGIQPCDALLVSHAILDPDAVLLLTTDGDLQESRFIQNQIRDREINRLKIRDYVSR